MTVQTPTARQRWKALHRARRAFRRDAESRRELLKLPGTRPADIYRAAMLLIDPPIIADDELNRIAGRFV